MPIQSLVECRARNERGIVRQFARRSRPRTLSRPGLAYELPSWCQRPRSTNSLPSGSAISTSSARSSTTDAPSDTSRSTSASRSGVGQHEVHPVARSPLVERRPAPGDLEPTLRRRDRGLAVLVVHQRPVERRRPEDPDLARPVGGDLAEEARAGQPVVGLLDHAELVALRVGQHDVVLVRQLPDVEVGRAELERASDVRLLRRGVAGQVEVHLVEPGPRQVRLLEDQRQRRLRIAEEPAPEEWRGHRDPRRGW